MVNIFLTPIVLVIESNLIQYVIKMIVDFAVEYNEVFDAAVKAGCHDFIRNLPNGYNIL